MVKIFTSQELRILVDGVDDLNKSDLMELIQCFPFENMINVSILNYDSMRLHLKLLIKLSKNDLFYANIQAVKYSLEFTLANLLSLENVPVDDILFNLLELLKYMICKAKTISEFNEDIVRDRERLFDILTLTTKLKIFGKSHVRNCTDILYDLLMINGPLPLKTSRNLAEISEIYKGLKVVYELALICNIVLKKFTISTEVFNVCIQWLLIYGPTFLEEIHEDDTLLELLKAMNEFCTKYSYIKDTEKHQNPNLLEVFEGFIQKLIWSSSEILDSMSSLIYSYNRFSIDLLLLKSLCYIYPVIMVDCLNKTTLLLGDELLIILMKFPHGLSKVYTHHLAQLVWVLKRGDYTLKKHVVCQWLKRDEESELLEKAILQCNVANILLDIIVDCKADELARDKAIEMTHRIKDDVLSKNIAMMIPTMLRYENVLHRLILSNPGMPDNTELAIKICEFMSMVLFLIVDENVLKAACGYCKYLITNLKKENDIVILFCQDMQNIKFLVIKVKYVNDETAAEILRLLKVLILVQKRNHNTIEEKVEVDLSECLVGSPNKVEKCLDLLQIIVTSKDVFIRLDESKIHNIFLNLFQLSKEPTFSGRSFICMTEILKRNGSLAYAYSTNLFIEIQCSLSVDEKSGPEFVMFLEAWMKILKNNVNENMYYVPNKLTIANYIQRAGFICQKNFVAAVYSGENAGVEWCLVPVSWTIKKLRRIMAEQQREAPERELEQQILQIKKQHQLQHQILLQHFQQQQQHLAEQHEQQLRQHLKEFWDRQKQLQEIRQREQLEALRKKEKHEESAVASTEVKQKLQVFLRQRASGVQDAARKLVL
ncbi:hypothetical protein NQ314_020843, partial [Rhamnusium bicolor]